MKTLKKKPSSAQDQHQTKPVIPPTVKSNEGLPDGWKWVKLEDVCDKISLNNIKIKQKDYLTEGKFPVVDQGQDLIGGYYNNENLIVPNEPPFIVFGDHTKVKKFISFKFIAGADGVKVLKPKALIDPKFLFYSLFIIKIEDKGYARHFQLLEKELFPLPGLPEQHAIVSKIEELLSELDKGKQQLETAQQQLKIYRQAVLKWAFEGKLTNENVKEGELPEGWNIDKIKNVCLNIKVGIVVKPTNFYSKNNHGIRAFRSANVREFRVNDQDWVYFSEEANELNKRTQIKAGDVLLVRSGYPGTSCVVPKSYEGCNAIDILIATPDNSKILPDFLCSFNNSPLGKGHFVSKSRGVAQKHLNVGEYSNLSIAYPSIEEQHKINQELASKLTVCDKIEDTIATSLAQAETLRQSILKKAFEGKLI